MLFGSGCKLRCKCGEFIEADWIERMGRESRKKSRQQQEPSSPLLDLPRVSDRLKDVQFSAEKIEIIYKKEYDISRGLKEGDNPWLIGGVDDTESLRQRLLDEILEASRDQLLQHEKVSSSFCTAAEGGQSKPVSPAPELPKEAPALWEQHRDDYEGTAVDFVREHYSRWIGVEGFNRSFLGRLDSVLAKAYAQRVGNHPDEELGLPSRSYTSRKDQIETNEQPVSSYVPVDQLSPEQREARRIVGAKNSAQYRQRKKADRAP